MLLQPFITCNSCFFIFFSCCLLCLNFLWNFQHFCMHSSCPHSHLLIWNCCCGVVVFWHCHRCDFIFPLRIGVLNATLTFYMQIIVILCSFVSCCSLCFFFFQIFQTSPSLSNSCSLQVSHHLWHHCDKNGCCSHLSPKL